MMIGIAFTMFIIGSILVRTSMIWLKAEMLEWREKMKDKEEK